MRMFYFGAVIVAMMLSPISSAFAKSGSGGNWLLGLDLSYLSKKSELVVNNISSESEGSTTYYDVNLGYMVTSNVLVGAILATKNTSNKGATVSTSTSGSATGASVGYIFDNGMHITGSYFLTATDQDYKGGSGYEVDFGWRNFISGSFFVGAKLAYRSLKYTENTTIPGFNSLTDTTTIPYLSFGFGF